jgi:hypothetical protein
MLIKFILIQQNKFFSTQCKLIINTAEIIAYKLELFKNPINDFKHQEISAEKGEINCNCVSAP